MANNYTLFSYLLPLTPDQIIYTSSLLARMENYDPDQDDLFIADLLNENETVDFKHHAEEGRYWFHADESGDPEQLALLIHHLITTFDLPPFGFQWAHTCSKPRIDEFGGGAVWITKKGFEWLSTDSWLYEKLHSRETR